MNKRMYFEKPCRLTKRSASTANDGTWSRFGLPLGNGKLGAMLGGEVFQEVIQLNEESLINGGPRLDQTYHHGNQGDSHKYLLEIQQLLLAGKTKEATLLCQKHLIGSEVGYGDYQNLGELVIGYQFSDTQVIDYQRALDLDEAIHYTTFQVGKNKVERQSFISYPEQLFVHHHRSQEKIDLFFCFQSEHPYHIEKNKQGWQVKGYLQENGLQFALKMTLVFSEGSIVLTEEGLALKNTSEVMILISTVTNYAPVFPAYRQILPLKTLEARLERGEKLGFEELKKRHLKDYQNLFQRVNFQLSKEESNRPLDQLVKTGGLPLAEILYHFGRYLLLSSSRQGSLPSNLQGVWNETNQPPWGGDYHLNVNLQMNYWGAAGGNLVETIEPLVKYVAHLREPGRLTAANYHGIVSNEEQPENGFTAHTQTTPFGFTGPGWDFEWGWSPAAVPWILENLYDVYLFTLDPIYLAEIYPLLRESTRFFEQTLVYNPRDSYYYSAPAYSPEHGPVTLGNTYEHVLIQQLILNTIVAAKVLELDAEKWEDWQHLANQIRIEEIGEEGQIKEWFTETTIGSVEKFEVNHRHVSHLLGLYPLHRITKESDLASGAVISLEGRGLGTTGWSMIHRGLMWARLGNGAKVEEIIALFFATCLHENLFATHPPFQIDANLGYVALVQEVLLQSQVGEIQLLPALPPSWSQGEITGLRARGKVTVDLKWANHQLEEAVILGEKDRLCCIELPDDIIHYQMEGCQVQEQNGRKVALRFTDKKTVIYRK